MTCERKVGKARGSQYQCISMLHTLRLDLYSSLESVLHFHRFLTWSHGTYYLFSEEFLSTGIREQKYVEGKKPAQADVLRVWLRSSCPVTCCDHAQIALRLGWLNRLRPPTSPNYGRLWASWIGRISSAAAKFLHIAMLQWCDVMSHSMLCLKCCFCMQ